MIRRRILQSSTLGAIIMVVAAVIALICANSQAYEIYENILDFHVGFYVSGFGTDNLFIGLTIEEWVNEVFMTLFFLTVGLEIKYEFFVGELQDIRKALLPIIAACGGVLVPIIVFVCFNIGGDHIRGFGIPMATDIAFAIGVLSLVGKGVPRGLMVFLQTLAIADDILAIVVIAVFYGQSPDPLWLAAACVVVILLMAMNRSHVYSLTPYMIGGFLLWVCVFFSGIECTIAGVILAFTIPTKSQINPRVFGKWTIAKVLEAKDRYIPGEPILAQEEYTEQMMAIHTVSRRIEPPLTRLNRILTPWVNFIILPLFAFFNAGVHLAGTDVGLIITDTVTLGVFFGLFIGKPIGISIASFLCIRGGLSPIPTGCNWKHVVGAGMLGGIGFTMAIYVANLSFTGVGAEEVTMMAKAAILTASVVSGIAGVVFLKLAIKHEEKEGAVFEEEETETEINRADIEELAEISETATYSALGEGEHLILTDHLGGVSDEYLVQAFMSAINDGDWTYTNVIQTEAEKENETRNEDK